MLKESSKNNSIAQLGKQKTDISLRFTKDSKSSRLTDLKPNNVRPQKNSLTNLFLKHKLPLENLSLEVFGSL